MAFYLILTSTFIAILSLALQRKHLLMSLLCLEMLILLLVSLLIISIGGAPIFNTSLFIVLLTFGACEASLGLALLVILMRSFGSDLINLLTLSKC